MGTFRVTAEVGDPLGQSYEMVEVLVDTGATYTTLPASLLRRLGVTPIARGTFVLADGSKAEREIGQTWMRLDGASYIVPVVFGDDGIQPLLGAVTLEIFRLGVDPVRKRLVPVPGLLMVSDTGLGNGPQTSNLDLRSHNMALQSAVH